MTAEPQQSNKKKIWKVRLPRIRKRLFRLVPWVLFFILLWFVFIRLIPTTVLFMDAYCYNQNERLWLKEELEEIEKLEAKAGLEPTEKLQIKSDNSDDTFLDSFIKPFCVEPTGSTQ